MVKRAKLKKEHCCLNGRVLPMENAKIPLKEYPEILEVNVFRAQFPYIF